MSISRLAALVIQSRSVRCEAGGPSTTNGRYAGWIMLDVPRWHPLLNTGPVYGSAEDAVKAMEEIVAVIRRTNFTPSAWCSANHDLVLVGQLVAAANAGMPRPPCAAGREADDAKA